MTYYIYHILGIKIGATKRWKQRSKQNFEMYGANPIIVETIEGLDNEEMWKIVGDREWELANQYGYPKGMHYLKTCIRALKGGWPKGRPSPHSVELMRALGASKKGKKNPNAKIATQASLRKVECIHCGKKAATFNHARWHGDNCKHKKTLTN